MTPVETVCAAVMLVGGVVGMFREEMGDLLEKILRWPSRGLDGMTMGGGKDYRTLFVIHDPPFWRVDRWVWALRQLAKGTVTGKVPVHGRYHRAFEKPRPPLSEIESRRRRAG